MRTALARSHVGSRHIVHRYVEAESHVGGRHIFGPSSSRAVANVVVMCEMLLAPPVAYRERPIGGRCSGADASVIDFMKRKQASVLKVIALF